MKRRCTILGILFFLSCTCFADTCVEIRKLKPVRHVCGIVANQNEERLSNATLTLFKAGVEVKTIQSSPDGTFDFGRLEAGDYELRGEAAGYYAARHTIKVMRPTEKCGGGLNVVVGLSTCMSGISNLKR